MTHGLILKAPSEENLKMLRYVEVFMVQHGYPPSIRQIAESCALGTSTVFHHLKMLERFGYITRDKYVARSMILTRKAKSELQADRS